MKKFLVLTACLAMIAVSVCNAKDRKVKPENLPATIQQFIKQNFPQSAILVVTQETDDKDYNVTLSNGTKVEFGKGDQWSELYDKHGRIPHHLIPSEIISYVGQHSPKASIVRIERCSQGYDIDLSNRKHIQLNKQFKPARFKESD